MRVVLSLLLATAAAPSLALDCGTPVDRDLTLAGDLDCRGSPSGLVVVRSGVRIDLAGHRIRSGAAGTAIVVEDVHGVSVHGPGRIEGGRTGIEAIRARGVQVRGIDFVGLGEGVRLTNASHAEITGNRFEDVAGHALVALSLPGALQRGGGHLIADNDVQGAEYGVLVDGAWARPSTISANRFDAIGSIGVLALAGGERLHNNEFGRIGVAEVVGH